MFALFHAICKRDLLGQGHDLIKKIYNCFNNKKICLLVSDEGMF